MSDIEISQMRYALQSIRLNLVLDIKPAVGVLAHNILQAAILMSELNFENVDTDDIESLENIMIMMRDSPENILSEIARIRIIIEDILGNDRVMESILCEALDNVYMEMASSFRSRISLVITSAYMVKQILEDVFTEEENALILLSYLDTIMELSENIIERISEICAEIRNKGGNWCSN